MEHWPMGSKTDISSSKISSVNSKSASRNPPSKLNLSNTRNAESTLHCKYYNNFYTNEFNFTALPLFRAQGSSTNLGRAFGKSAEYACREIKR